ncbi:hypothetical protein SAMN06273570_0171 [Candidatus Pantoea floridensis]|uniref:Biofilm development protein YmgB/AriR n=2 Tax=Erwiniaceae TaxID=1903409 RepID=A0A286BM67_9GAMM|nr:hypothetical protein BX596_1848 [Enterobacteriaceae bacterium JKS000233]SOD35235.1 hypothetical protein SAMN06273570_0171 [Pantoea floridensis]
MPDCIYIQASEVMLRDENRPTPDLYALIGMAVAEFIREERVFKAHDISLSLHVMKSGTKDKELRRLCDAAMRLLAGMMH